MQLALALLVVSVAGWWVEGRIKAANARRFVPASELDRIEYAISRATSWHVSTSGTIQGKPFQSDQDVVCPFQSHILTRGMGSEAAGAIISEIIETQDHMYAREGDATWSSVPKAASDKCRVGPMAGPTPLIATLASLKSAILVRGDVIKAGSDSCRVWNFVSGNGGALLASVCVDDATRLPYEFKMGAVDAHYTYWDMPIVIETPVLPTPAQ